MIKHKVSIIIDVFGVNRFSVFMNDQVSWRISICRALVTAKAAWEINICTPGTSPISINALCWIRLMSAEWISIDFKKR